MKYLIVLLVVSLSSCATVDTRQRHWMPVDKAGKTAESTKMDNVRCYQLAQTVDKRSVYNQCMIQSGYVMVVFAEDKKAE